MSQELRESAPYRRFTPAKWDHHKDIIRRLFLEQDKTHKDVACILKEDYGFPIGYAYRLLLSGANICRL